MASIYYADCGVERLSEKRFKAWIELAVDDGGKEYHINRTGECLSCIKTLAEAKMAIRTGIHINDIRRELRWPR
jgi:hypothetical protein